MRDTVEFIRINQYLMTLTEIAKELGEPVARIKYLCRIHGFKCVTKGDKAKDFIILHKSLSIQDVVAELNMSERSIRRYFKELGLDKKNPGY